MLKKVLAIVSLSIIGILIIATIIMANVNIHFGVKCSKPVYVYVHYSTNVAQSVSKAQISKIKSLIDESSKEKSLTALFNGDLKNKATVSVTASSKTVPSTSEFSVRFVYNNPQNIMEGNKKYKDGDGKSYTYTELVFTISKTEGTEEAKVYIIEDSTKPNSYTHYYVLDADFSNVYSYLVDQGFKN